MSVQYLGQIEGIEGTYKTLHQIQRLVKLGSHDPVIVNLARDIVKDAGPDPYNRAEALYRWVRDNIEYVHDPKGTEWLKHPRKVLRAGIGDCDEMVTLLGAMYRAVRIPAVFVIAGPYGGNYRHIYLAVKVGDQWIPADPTNKHGYFGWQQSVYPKIKVIPMDGSLEGLDFSIGDVFKKVTDALRKVREIATGVKTVAGQVEHTSQQAEERLRKTRDVWQPPPPKTSIVPPQPKKQNQTLLWLGLGLLGLLLLTRR